MSGSLYGARGLHSDPNALLPPNLFPPSPHLFIYLFFYFVSACMYVCGHLCGEANGQKKAVRLEGSRMVVGQGLLGAGEWYQRGGH